MTREGETGSNIVLLATRVQSGASILWCAEATTARRVNRAAGGALTEYRSMENKVAAC